MSIATLILGESGTGKSTSLRNLEPSQVSIYQCTNKPLPFRSANWKESIFNYEMLCQVKGENGMPITLSPAQTIIRFLTQSKKDILIIDDFQYLMSYEFMRGVGVKYSKDEVFDRYNWIGRNAWSVFDCAVNLPGHKRIYILAHTDTDEFGKTKIKTIGRMLDSKITLDGMVTICLRTHVADGKYHFSTQNNGSDTVKSPMGLFESDLIDNDLKAVDDAICDYWGIAKN